MTISRDSLWFITGCSSGIGAALAREIAARGYRLAATARDAAALAADRITALPLDLSSAESIRRAVAALESLGPVGVLVNNAGHGYVATVEEGEDEKIRALFEVNFFGAAALIRALLPAMRANGGGHIVNVSSTAGLSGNPGSAYYAASKFALEGLSEALAGEVAGFGIGVTLVEPGPFRTDFICRSIASSPQLPAYAGLKGNIRTYLREIDGRQPGDPARLAALLADVLEGPAPPRRLIVGRSAMDIATRKIDRLRADLEAFRERSAHTDFDADGDIPTGERGR